MKNMFSLQFIISSEVRHVQWSAGLEVHRVQEEVP
jgi:hypothetical protein